MIKVHRKTVNLTLKRVQHSFKETFRPSLRSFSLRSFKMGISFNIWTVTFDHCIPVGLELSPSQLITLVGVTM